MCASTPNTYKQLICDPDEPALGPMSLAQSWPLTLHPCIGSLAFRLGLEIRHKYFGVPSGLEGRSLCHG